MSDSPSSTFRTRLVEEADQLRERHNKLIAFISTANFVELPVEQQHLLTQQAHHMSCYLAILRRRLELVAHPVSDQELPTDED